MNCNLHFEDLGIGWSVTNLKNEKQLSFLIEAMKYVVEPYWTYYIGGSGHPTTQVEPFRHCLSEYSNDDSGNISLISCIIYLLDILINTYILIINLMW